MLDLTPNSYELIPMKEKIISDDSISSQMGGSNLTNNQVSGSLGGWQADATSLTATNNGNQTILSSGDTAFSAGPIGNPTVTITQTGVLTASGANITGSLTATTGTIGGWTISSSAIYLDGLTAALSSGMASGDYPFYAGAKYADRASAVFKVTPAGTLTCSSVVITGGTIAGANVSSLGYLGTITADIVPTGLTASATSVTTATDGTISSNVTLTWTAIATDTFDHYQIRFKKASYTYYFYLDSNTNTITIDGLVPNTSYNFGISSVNKYGTLSAFSSDISQTTANSTTAPATVTTSSATAGIQYVVVEWTHNTDADLASYNIYRNTANDSATSTLIGNCRTNYFVDGGRTGGQIYYYWVKAVNTSSLVSASFSTVQSATPRNVTSDDVVTLAGSKVLIDGAVYLSNWRHSSDLTKIDGGDIYASSITTSQLNFTPVQSTDVIAKINASVEGIKIDADNISISGSTTFSSGYDPTSKVDELGGSYASAASGARVLVFPDANTGLQIIDDAAADVLKVLVGGTDVGDVIIGNYSGGQGLKYDKSANTTTFAGALSAATGTLGSITAGTFTGVTIAIGTDDSIFKADSNGIYLGNATFASAPFRVTPSGALTATSATITGALTTGAGSSLGVSYLSGIVGLANTNVAAQGWTSTIVFSSTDYNTVAWAAGTLTTSAGTAYAIDAGNTGNMAATTYIYLDIAVSTTVLQITTTAATAIGSGKVLIAVAKVNTDTTSDAIFQVFGGTGGETILVDNIAANSASTNEFVSNTAQIANLIVTDAKINTLSANKIVAGTGIINALDVLSTLTMGSEGTNGIIQSYGWNGTANGFQLLGGATPSFTLIGGTLTAPIIQTATTGQRLYINVGDEETGYNVGLSLFNSANQVTSVLFPNGNAENYLFSDIGTMLRYQYRPSNGSISYTGKILDALYQPIIVDGSTFTTATNDGRVTIKDDVPLTAGNATPTVTGTITLNRKWGLTVNRVAQIYYDPTSGTEYDFAGFNYGSSAKQYKIQIDGDGSPNTFKWSDDNGANWVETGLPLYDPFFTYRILTSSDGSKAYIRFSAETGGVIGDYWTFTSGGYSLVQNNVLSVQQGNKINSTGDVINIVNLGTCNDIADDNGNWYIKPTGAATFLTTNGLTLTSAATGFTIAGGTSSKTLTLDADLTASAIPNNIGCVASDNLKYSADTYRTTGSSSYVKVKEIKINLQGVVRVKFDMKSQLNLYGVNGRVYINGVAIGTERSTDSATYVTFSEDFNVNINDLVQLYIHQDTGGSGTDCDIQNFRIYYDNSSLVEGVVVTD